LSGNPLENSEIEEQISDVGPRREHFGRKSGWDWYYVYRYVASLDMKN